MEMENLARPELLQLADALAREKGIDRDDVLDAIFKHKLKSRTFKIRTGI